MMSSPPIADALFVVEGGSSVGMGHVWRSTELAAELGRMGLSSVISVNDDPASLKRIADSGVDLFGGGPRCGALEELDFEAAPPRIIFDLPRVESERVRLAAGAAGDRWTLALDYFLLDDPGVRSIINLFNHSTRPRPPESVDYREGPAYAIIRACFDEFVQRPRARDSMRTVLVSLGGSDPARHMLAAIDAAARGDVSIRYRFIVGSAFAHAAEVGLAASGLGGRAEVLCNPPEVERLMWECDAAFTNGGTTFMECLALALPTVVIPYSEDERRFAESIAGDGAARVLGGSVTAEAIARAISRLRHDETGRRQLALNGRRLVDGKGRQRIARVIQGAVGAGAPA